MFLLKIIGLLILLMVIHGLCSLLPVFVQDIIGFAFLIWIIVTLIRGIVKLYRNCGLFLSIKIILIIIGALSAIVVYFYGLLYIFRLVM